MKNKFYYIFCTVLISVSGFLTSCEDEGDVTDGIRDVGFKATAVNRTITEGDAITYIDSSLNVVSRLWTFNLNEIKDNDISTSDLATVDVTYPTGTSLNDEGRLPGYLTQLEVTHDDGTIERGEFVVGVYKKVSVDFEAEETEVIVGTSTTFTSTIEDLTSAFVDARDRDAIQWIFEGGTPATSTDENPTVTYNTLGTYKVTLAARRQSPLSIVGKSIEAYIDVVEPTPVVSIFSANETTVSANSSIVFNDDSSGAPDQWLWTFEGGTPATSTEENPVIIYATQGTYSVTLQATRSSDGLSDTETIASFITVTEPDNNIVKLAGVDADFASLTGWDLQTPPTANTPAEDYSIVTNGGINALRIQAGNLTGEKNAVFRTADLGEIPAGDYTFTFRYMLESGDRTATGALEMRIYLAGFDDAITIGSTTQVTGLFKMQTWTEAASIGVWQETTVDVTLAAPIPTAALKLQMRFGPAHANNAVIQIDSVSLEAK